MSDDLERKASENLAFYDREARKVLQEILGDRIGEVDQAADALRRALAARPLIRVGFLGESQVGKSSIINALVGQRVLPSGGIGPLTAQKTQLVHADSPSFRVRYHGRQRLNAFRFALERYFEWRRGAESGSDGTHDTEFEAHVFDTNREEDDANANHERHRVGDHLVGQACLMLGLSRDQVSDAELMQLVRAFAASDESVVEIPAEPALRQRIADIRRICDTTEEISEKDVGAAFRAALRLRAAGWMSPLIAELSVSLAAPLLQHVELLDLPGVGVVGDPAARIAERFVAEQADAVVVVMRNNGLTEQVAELLEDIGIVSRLLWTAESPHRSVNVIVAVTHLDDVARDTWRQRTLEAREMGEPPPDRATVFRELAEPMAANVKQQITQALMASRELEDLTPEQREQRIKVIRSLAERMQVLCVAAPDYLAIREGFADDAFLRTEEATNIPRLAEALVGLSRPLLEERRQRLSERRAAFVSTLSAILTEEEFRHRLRQVSPSDADRFRKACEQAAEPLKAEAARAKEAFYGFLDSGLRGEVSVIASEAAAHAHKRLSRLKATGRGLAWQTLNAALARGASFRGSRHRVDYPGSLTKAFVDVIAASWDARVTKKVQDAHAVLRKTEEGLVEELVAKASKLVDSEEEARALGRLPEQARRKERVAAGLAQAELSKLTEKVRVRVLKQVAPVFEKACLEARKAGVNRGKGATARVLEVFDVAGRKAIDQVKDEVTATIARHIVEFRDQLTANLEQSGDPVTRALETIIAGYDDVVAKANEDRRKKRREAVRSLYEKLKAIESGAFLAKDEMRETSPPSRESTAGSSEPEGEEGLNVRAVGDIFDDL